MMKDQVANFFVCQFGDEKIEIVPNNWVTKMDETTHMPQEVVWPDTDKRKTVRFIASKQDPATKLSTTNWTVHKVTHTYATCIDYRDAHEKATIAEDESDVERVSKEMLDKSLRHSRHVIGSDEEFSYSLKVPKNRIKVEPKENLKAGKSTSALKYPKLTDETCEIAGTWKAEQLVSASIHQYPKIKEDDNSAEMLRAEEAKLMQQFPNELERAENIGDVDEVLHAPIPTANTQSNPQNVETNEHIIFELNADVSEEHPVVNPLNDLAGVQSSTLNADSSMTDPTAREYYYLMCLEHAAEENAKLDQKVQTLRTSLKKNQEKTQRAARRNICGNISRSNYRNVRFDTKAALEEYSTELKSNPVEEERFKEYIERIQSGNHGPVTRAILRKIMTDNCATNYNMSGINRKTMHGVETGYNKAAFEDLHIYHVIVDAVMNICKVSEGDVKTAVKNWLKAAPARRSHA